VFATGQSGEKDKPGTRTKSYEPAAATTRKKNMNYKDERSEEKREMRATGEGYGDKNCKRRREEKVNRKHNTNT